MKKKTIERITGTLPTIFKNAVDYLKDNFEENGQDILGEASGTAGVIVKLVGQPMIDKYFQKIQDEKLEDFGFNVYLKAALEQANESIDEIKTYLNHQLEPKEVFEITEKIIRAKSLQFDPKDALLIFRPKYHPAVVYVKDQYQQILRGLGTPPEGMSGFTRHFNEHILEQIGNEFGNDYEAHIEEIKQYQLKENETHFLWDMVQLGQIGFQESEDLAYEETFGRWKKVSQFREREDENLDDEESNELENSLTKIEDLIEAYFDIEPENHLKKILFIIADFGKGKSVFLKQYASQLAKYYLENQEGTFPVYFNLRNFGNYSSEPKLGVISDFLLEDYKIKIDDEHFRQKKYVFLIDSLDESSELTRYNVDQVISSIKKIQSIDKERFRTNRIIITSRPIDEGLSAHLTSHQPWIKKNEQKRDIEYFISIYGFKKEQFNHWVSTSLRTFPQLEDLQPTGFAKKVIDLVKSGSEADIYKELVDNGTLSKGELRRPIFAYMIYQLILNDIDFATIGKMGVYLSFLNLLTKEAKHINDPSHKIDLRKEFEFRNILHAIAALWQYQRQSGKQGGLKKADICRTISGENISPNDNEVLKKFKDEGVTEIQFLSHSYFGEKNNVLHFNHQSFAEILLAEYYLKVFIRYGLDKQQKVEEARAKLVLGEPTSQTIDFLVGLLNLLRDASVDKSNAEVIEKRRMLVGLMASLATDKHNPLYSSVIDHRWYEDIEWEDNQADISDRFLKNWCIKEKQIDRIIDLARKIIGSETHFLLMNVDARTTLFGKEAVVFSQKLNEHAPDMDRWLALLVGNELYNVENEKRFFNGTVEKYTHLFDLVRNWNYAFNQGAPDWGTRLFKGIDMDGERIYLRTVSMSGLNFSFSKLRNLNVFSGIFYKSIFEKCVFENCSFNMVDFFNVSFDDSIFVSTNSFVACQIGTDVGFPIQLYEALRNNDRTGLGFTSYVTMGMRKTNIGNMRDYGSRIEGEIKKLFKPIRGILIFALKNSWFSINEVKEWFDFESDETKERFFDLINELKPYEQPLEQIETKKKELGTK